MILQRSVPAALAVCVAASAPASPLAAPSPWGEDGHRLIAAAAAAALPGDVPAFFRAAGPQLSYLNPEPDRWRARELPAMDQAFSPDHFVDLERVPEGALDQPDRWSYLRALARGTPYAAPERDVGLLPFSTLELYQRLLVEWRLWRAASPTERPWIEQRIVNDAGILGHFVADGSQPLHTTVHFDGWDRDAPNPERFSTERGLHSRFESAYVRAHVPAGMSLRVGGEANRLDDVPGAIRAYLFRSHDQVPTLYRIDRRLGFDPNQPPAPEALRFTIGRMEAGAAMLRDLWWTAWLKSGDPVPR